MKESEILIKRVLIISVAFMLTIIIGYKIGSYTGYAEGYYNGFKAAVDSVGDKADMYFDLYMQSERKHIDRLIKELSEPHR